MVYLRIEELLNKIKSLFEKKILFVSYWNSLLLDDKILLSLRSNKSGLTLLHLICYYTPYKEDITDFYLINYFPILEWICLCIKKNDISNDIFNSKCEIINIDPTYMGKNNIISPLIISSYRNHMIYITQFIICGCNPYILDNGKSTLTIIKNNDDYKISHFTEMFSIFCLNSQKGLSPSQKYPEIRKIHDIFYYRRFKIIENIYKAKELIESGFGYVLSIIELNNINIYTCPIIFITKIIPILENYLNEIKIYNRYFNPEYSTIYSTKTTQITEIFEAIRIAKNIILTSFSLYYSSSSSSTYNILSK